MTKKILLLGSGELGKEFVIAAQRLGQYVIACDSYAGAPAMQVADACEVFSMLDGDALEEVVMPFPSAGRAEPLGPHNVLVGDVGGIDFRAHRIPGGLDGPLEPVNRGIANVVIHLFLLE